MLSLAERQSQNRHLAVANNRRTAMSRNISSERGFDTLREASDLKLRFDRAGPAGLTSFAKACIWSGIDDPEDIIAEARAITGDHVENELGIILMEGENIHWSKTGRGRLALLIAL
ncbi:hypothetical protein G6N82_06100 [Altererythrobacter sp. BO-6]|uniref:hypothetical protein n=1 Tax=Altererythrobacter sp. BO-6 TaxID=2604537 RepID=UPI0013E1389F|nr:hypothetical protein [Altererythrobacter sp. BO-6]QIG53783.1 hypothetical protein G6N82_06100 [Altererythrobacter sp. BO-6]